MDFPSLYGSDVVEEQNMEEPKDGTEDFLILPSNPIEEKNQIIAALEKDLEDAKTNEQEINKLKEELTKKNAELKIAKSKVNLNQKKINFARNATEDLLIESISSPTGFRENPTLVRVYSATLNEDDFDLDEDETEAKESSNIRSRKDQFLKSIEDKLDPTNMEHKERFHQIKNQILEKVKHTKVSQMRARSGSTIGSKSSLKRSRSESDEKGVSNIRPRTQLPKPF